MIGERIRTARESAGLSQAQLAEMAGTSQQTVDRIERGVTEFSRSTQTIMEALGIGTDATQPAEARVAIFRERLAQRRDECGFNDYSLALAMGANESYVRDILRGRMKEPTVWKLFDLARTLDCSPQWLIGLDDVAPPVTPSDSDGGVLRQAAAVLRSYGRDASAEELDELAQIITKAQERAKA